MMRLDDLPADQKATLQLLVKQGKSYDDLAGLLRLEPHAVRDRALNALDALGPEDVDGLAPERQDEVSDYLLGQQSASQRQGTRTFLESSAAGRSWARTVAGQLRPFAGDALPDIPSDPEEVAEAFDAVTARRAARERQEQSSRAGGILLLLGAAAIVAVLVVLVVSKIGGDDDNGDDASVSDAPAATQTASTGTGATSTDGAANPNDIELQIPMTTTKGNALASGFIIKNNGERVLGITGQDFAPTDNSTFSYAVWLSNPGGKALRLGFVGSGVPASGNDKGRLVTAADPSQIEQAAKQTKDTKVKAAAVATAKTIRTALKDIYSYKELLITREAAKTDPQTPGTVVVSGPIVKPAASGG